MGKHEGKKQEPTDEDRLKIHQELRELPTYQSKTPASDYTDKPAKP